MVLGSSTLAASGLFQTREVGRRARNEPYPPRNGNTTMFRGWIVERDEGILLHLLGSGKPLGETPGPITLLKFRPNGLTERFESADN